MALTLNKQLLDNESRIDLILSIEDVINPLPKKLVLMFIILVYLY